MQPFEKNPRIRSGTRVEREAMTAVGMGEEFYETDHHMLWTWFGSWRQPITPPSGIARNRIVSVTHATLPSLLSDTGVGAWTTGVRGVIIDSVRVTAGTVPLAANNNWVIRYAIEAANDAAAAILLPTTPPTPGATKDIGQVRSFNVLPIVVPDTEAAGDGRVVWLALTQPVYIDITDPILRLDFAHNLGTGVTIELMISALEAA